MRVLLHPGAGKIHHNDLLLKAVPILVPAGQFYEIVIQQSLLFWEMVNGLLQMSPTATIPFQHFISASAMACKISASGKCLPFTTETTKFTRPVFWHQSTEMLSSRWQWQFTNPAQDPIP
jgi:hypothetical protein